MEHHFKTEDAQKYGIEKAILLYNINFWLEKNKANNVNIHKKDGKEYWWTFNSATGFQKLFPYMKAKSIGKWLQELEKDGALLTGQFNVKGYDKTKWYTTDFFCSTLPPGEQPIPTTEQSIALTEQPIPDNKPDNKQQINIYIPDTEKEAVEVVTLPESRGQTPVARLSSVYQTVFQSVFGCKSKQYGLLNRSFTTVLKSYSELQVATLLTIFFEWKGMDGNNSKERDFLLHNAYTPYLFVAGVQKYEIYARNVARLDFDDDKALFLFVKKYITGLSPG